MWDDPCWWGGSLGKQQCVKTANPQIQIGKGFFLPHLFTFDTSTLKSFKCETKKLQDLNLNSLNKNQLLNRTEVKGTGPDNHLDPMATTANLTEPWSNALHPPLEEDTTIIPVLQIRREFMSKVSQLVNDEARV